MVQNLHKSLSEEVLEWRYAVYVQNLHTLQLVRIFYWLEWYMQKIHIPLADS